MAIDNSGISSLDAGASDITYSGNEGPKSPQQEQQMQMASLMQEYKDYVMQQEEAGRPAMPFEEWVRSIQSPMAEGGIARLGYRGGQLVQPGLGRPGYAGRNPFEETGQTKSEQRDIARDVRSLQAQMEGTGGRAQDYVDVYADPSRLSKIDTFPEEKTIPQKAKDIFLGPASFALKQVSKKHSPYYIKHALENYKKKMGYMDDPALYEEMDEDDFIKQALIDIDLAKEGNLSTKEFEKYMPDWQLDIRYGRNKGDGPGDQALPYYPQDMHPGTGDDTDPTDPTDPGWDVGRLDQPFDRSTPGHDFSSEYFYGADGGRPGYAGGGITDLRQAYGLGKFVKKIGKTFKKIAKSPLGKAALAFAAYKFGPQLLSGKGFGLGDTKKWGDLIWSGGTKAGQNVNLARMIGLPSLMGGAVTAMAPEEEEEGYNKWLAEKNRWLGQIGDFPTTPVDPLYQRNLMAADGGRIGYAGGGYYDDDDDEEEGHRSAALSAMYRDRMGAQEGGIMQMASAPDPMDERNMVMEMLARDTFGKPLKDLTEDEIIEIEIMLEEMSKKQMASPRMMAQEGGLMDLGGMEKDYRQEGGFVPLGGEERADDVPARLSKNEFVFTADAVRAAGGGDIDAGAEVMENLMENLEQGGQVSKESQGLEGARDMFATAQRLEGVL